jgi:hypothetical protein
VDATAWLHRRSSHELIAAREVLDISSFKLEQLLPAYYCAPEAIHALSAGVFRPPHGPARVDFGDREVRTFLVANSAGLADRRCHQVGVSSRVLAVMT